MARSRTRTFTSTFTRTDVVAFQVKYVVTTTTKCGDFAAVVEKGIINNKWIEVVYVRALDADEKIHAEILMRIDWERQKLHIEAGEDFVEIDETLPEGYRLSDAIGAIVDFFNEKVMANRGLKTQWLVNYVKGVDRDKVRKELGLGEGVHQEWAIGERIHVLGKVPELLDEFEIDLTVLTQEGAPGEAIERPQGTVKWFSKERGYGFIKPHDGKGDLFVHESQIVGSGLRSLKEGQVVEFDIEDHWKGRRAVNVNLAFIELFE